MKDKIKAEDVTFRLSSYVIQRENVGTDSHDEGLNFHERVFYASILVTAIYTIACY